MHPKGNIQLQIRKWWVPLRSALYVSFFLSYLCQYISIKITRFPTEKIDRETFHFFKTTMLHPSTVPLSNVKLKRVLKVNHVIYNDIAGGNNISKCQHTEKFMRKVRALLYYIHVTTIKNACAFSSYNFTDLYDSTYKDVFLCHSICQGI